MISEQEKLYRNHILNPSTFAIFVSFLEKKQSFIKLYVKLEIASTAIPRKHPTSTHPPIHLSLYNPSIE